MTCDTLNILGVKRPLPQIKKKIATDTNTKHKAHTTYCTTTTTMASTTLTQDPVIIASLFKKYDADNSQTIDTSELESLLSDLGVTLQDEHQKRAILMLVDKDGSGTVSLDEFLSWWSKMVKDSSFARFEKNMAMAAYVCWLFVQANCTANGSLPNSKFAQVYQQLYDMYHAMWPSVYGQAMYTTEQAVKHLDIDGDGNIIFYELMHWLNWV